MLLCGLCTLWKFLNKYLEKSLHLKIICSTNSPWVLLKNPWSEVYSIIAKMCIILTSWAEIYMDKFEIQFWKTSYWWLLVCMKNPGEKSSKVCIRISFVCFLWISFRYFEKQFQLAEETKLPMFLHSRSAHQDFIGRWLNMYQSL